MAKQATFIPVFHAFIPVAQENSIEERFLFEYLASAFYPLLRVFEGLENEGIDYGFTFALSPVLSGMLDNPELMLRFADYMQWRLAAATAALTAEPEKAGLLNYQISAFKDILYWHGKRYHYRPLKALLGLAALGHIEVIFSGASNGVLPLLEGVPAAVSAEIRAGVQEYQRLAEGAELHGLWPAELAYARGCEEALAAEGIEYIYVAESAFRDAGIPVVSGCARPVVLPGGMAALGVNRRLSAKVGLADGAYCYDPNYLHCGSDSFSGLAAELLPSKLSIFAGTGSSPGIDIYNRSGAAYEPQKARDAADRHAGHYLSLLTEEVRRHNVDDGVVVLALEHDLTGVFWRELPVFIDMLLRKMRFDQELIRAGSAGSYLAAGRELQEVNIADSSSAEGIFAEFYAEQREHFLPELHLAAQRLTGESITDERIGAQMARELLLAQGYEWRFYHDRGIDEDYARERQRKRLARFAACDQMLREGFDPELLAALEERTPVLGSVSAACFQR